MVRCFSSGGAASSKILCLTCLLRESAAVRKENSNSSENNFSPFSGNVFVSVSHPLISVIMPTYNCGKFLVEGIRSILDQDYPQKEILVIDDGSTDDTLAILQQFG